MKNNRFTGLIILFLFFSVVVSANAAIVFEDSFDNPSWTNSQWMIYDLGHPITPVWDFVPITGSYPGDLGYRGDTFGYSQEIYTGSGSTVTFAQNFQMYETRNLTISTLIKLDAPDVNPYNSVVTGGIALPVDRMNSYGISLQVDYEDPAIEFDFGFTETISGTHSYLIRTDLTGKIDYNIFYNLSVHIDSDGYFDIILTNYESGEELVNIIDFEPSSHFENVLVGLSTGGKATFNDFFLKGNPVVDSGGLQGFNKYYYLAAKLAALKANDSSWIGKNVDYLETLLFSVGFTAESHYSQYGYKEGLGPNAYFNHYEYVLAKATAMHNSGGYPSVEAARAAFNAAWPHDAYQHYLKYGAAEGINPSNFFDESAYLADKLAALRAEGIDWDYKTIADLRNIFASYGMTVLDHYMNYGRYEGLSVTPVPGY